MNFSKMKQILLSTGYVYYPTNTHIKLLVDFITYMDDEGIRVVNNVHKNRIELD